MKNKIEWWGYLHSDGSIHVKRYFAHRDLVEAMESPFVHSISGPWPCKDRNKALEKAREVFCAAD